MSLVFWCRVVKKAAGLACHLLFCRLPGRARALVWRGTAVALLFSSGSLMADLINPNVLDLTQPDGTKIQLRFKGTGQLNWYEDLAGFPVVKVGNTFYYQQELGLTQRNGVLPEVGKVDPKTADIEKITAEARFAAFETDLLQPQGTPENFNQITDIQAVAPGGTVKNLVVLIRFADHLDRELPTRANYETLFNAIGGDPEFAPTGSIRDIYLENSYQQLSLESTVVDWFTVSGTEADYADGDSGLLGTVIEALVESLDNADTVIDFSQFDSNNDGHIDAITFVHSGYAAEWGGTDAFGTEHTDRIWSHQHNMPSWTSSENVSVSNYNINPGVWSTSGSEIGRVGVIAHELGHFFGLPDLYDFSTPGAGIGYWGLMGNSWGFNDDQLHPPHMSAWSKAELGWVSPTKLTAPGVYDLTQVETTPRVYKIDEGFPDGEYLLLENRQPVGTESAIPQGGLAVWHINENRDNNSDQSYPPLPSWPVEHYKVSLLQADGLYDLEKGNGFGDAGDLYHGGGVNAVNSTTSPSTDHYQTGTLIPSGVAIGDISASGNPMRFTYGVPNPDPWFTNPSGEETYTQGSTETITWNASGAPDSTKYTVELGHSCLSGVVFTEDVQSTPSNFTASNDGGAFNWVFDNNNPYEGTGNWHAENPAVVEDQYMTSVSVNVPDIDPVLSFWHSYDFEENWDGGVLEASIDDGLSWTDLGQWVTQNDYSHSLNNSPNPLAGRSAFSGSSDGYVNTLIDLSSFSGQAILMRFRVGSDDSRGAPEYTGWDVDLITVSGASPVMTPVGIVNSTELQWIASEPPGQNYCFSIVGESTSGSTNLVYSGLFDIVLDQEEEQEEEEAEEEHEEDTDPVVVSNSTFEDGLTGWVQVEPALESNDSFDGTGAAKLQPGGSISLTVEVIPEQDYTLNVMLKVKVDTVNGETLESNSGSSSILVGSETIAIPTPGSGNSYELSTVEFNTGSSDEVTITFAGGDLRVDNVVLETTGDTSEPEPDSDPVVLSNSTFEDGLAGWVQVEPVLESNDSFNSTGAAKLQPGGSISLPVEVIPEQNYTLNVMLKVKVDTVNGETLESNSGSSSILVGGETIDIPTPSSGNSYELSTVEFNTGNSDEVTIMFTGGDLRVDDVILEGPP